MHTSTFITARRARLALGSSLLILPLLADCGGDTSTTPQQPGPPAPTRLSVAAGDGQIVGAGRAVSVIPSVQVSDAAGAPVAGAVVTFAVVTGGGTITGATATTTATGSATVGGWTLGMADGVNTLTATVTGLPPVTFTAHGVLGGIVAGGDHTCGIASGGTAFCWGRNIDGRLGAGDVAAHTSPTPVVGGLTFASLVAGTDHTCGITGSGGVYCWGNNTFGQLGLGDRTNRTSPTAVATVGLSFTTLAAGSEYTCGLTTAGAVYCWGYNPSGGLGVGDKTDRLSPTLVVGGNTFTALVTGGLQHTCGLTAAGVAYCWGRNIFGELGVGDQTDRLSPAPIAGGVTFAALAAGANHTCGLSNGGTAYCWGYNRNGELGLGDNKDRSSPTAIAAGGIAFTAIVAGGGHNCGLTAAGATYCWGDNRSGQLGDGTLLSRQSRTPIWGLSTFTALAAGNAHTCGLTSSGAAFCWGSNRYALGSNTPALDLPYATAVIGGLTFLGRP